MLVEIGKPKFSHFWQFTSCHFWQFYEAAISGNFTTLPFLATAQSCHFWQLHKSAIQASFICKFPCSLPFLATYELPFLQWQLYEATIPGNYITANFGNLQFAILEQFYKISRTIN